MEYHFSDLFTWTSGKPITPTGGEIPVYGSNGIIGYSEKAQYNNKIILGRVGAYCGSVEYCPSDFNATDNTLITTCDTSKISYNYAYYLLKQFSLNRYAGGAAQPLITQGLLKHLKCDIPSIKQQQNIVSILSTYDSLIEVNNKRIKVLEQMAENLYKEWFVRFRFPGHETAEFENGIPKGWEKRRLGDFICFERGVSYSSTDLEDGGYVLLSMNNIRPFGGFIRDYSRAYCGKFKQHQLVDKGDLLMSITDMTQDRRIIGYTGMVGPGGSNRIISMHLLKLSSKEYGNLFLTHLFNCSGLSRIIAEHATGTNVLGMTPDILNRIKTLCPPKELATQYENMVSPIIQIIHLCEQKNDNLIRQRDLLLPRLMSGKLEV